LSVRLDDRSATGIWSPQKAHAQPTESRFHRQGIPYPQKTSLRIHHFFAASLSKANVALRNGY
jgi:hypothetical protein